MQFTIRRCGEEETINHVLFECPPALQTWALLNIPSAPGCFLLTSIFSNMDYLFWRLPNKSSKFSWIIWYLWKAQNDKVFKNVDRDLQEILQLAEAEA